MTESDGHNDKVNLLGLSRQKMEQFFVDIGEKKFRAGQVMKWIHQYGVDDFEAMTNVSKVLRARLAELAEIRGPEVPFDEVSQDGTRKWVMRMAEGNSIEAVLIPDGERGTLCVSPRRLAAASTAVSAPQASRDSTGTCHRRKSLASSGPRCGPSCRLTGPRNAP